MENIEQINWATKHKTDYLNFYRQFLLEYANTKNPIYKEILANLVICIKSEEANIKKYQAI